MCVCVRMCVCVFVCVCVCVCVCVYLCMCVHYALTCTEKKPLSSMLVDGLWQREGKITENRITNETTSFFPRPVQPTLPRDEWNRQWNKTKLFPIIDMRHTIYGQQPNNNTKESSVNFHLANHCPFAHRHLCSNGRGLTQQE